MTIIIKGEKLILLPEKAIYWERRKILLLADLHLGKSGHFRKAGIPLPSQIHHHDLERLSKIISNFPVEKIYFLGDLFHSVQNNEWNHFTEWRRKVAEIEIHLIKGNHDILDEEQFNNAQLILHEFLIDSPFIFYHKINKNTEDNLYQIAGHIHPGVLMKGKGRQSEMFSCFYFGEKEALLPAYGNFTGHVTFPLGKKDNVFIIVNDKIVAYK